jgi:hypothetical protein
LRKRPHGFHNGENEISAWLQRENTPNLIDVRVTAGEICGEVQGMKVTVTDSAVFPAAAKYIRRNLAIGWE